MAWLVVKKGANMRISAHLPNRIDAQISLQPESRFIGVTGPSGAGKSSLFRALAGVEKSAKVETPWPSQKVGIVFQQPILFPHTDVRGNLALAQRHASPTAMPIDACLRGCYCEHLIDKPIHALSGGEAQRVAIARALVNGPDVLLLDESLSAIDVFTRRKIYQFLKNLCVSGQLTCFVISHDLDDLALFSDELIYIDRGRAELCGPTRDVLARVFERESFTTPSSLLEGEAVATPHKSDDNNQNKNAGSNHNTNSDRQEGQYGSAILTDDNSQADNGIVLILVAGHEIYVSEESVSYFPQHGSEKLSARFAVKACDVSIDTNIGDFGNASTISILNALPCVISSINPVSTTLITTESATQKVQTQHGNTHSAKMLLKLNVRNSNQTLYASISHLSLTRLHLETGMQVIARFKLP